MNILILVEKNCTSLSWSNSEQSLANNYMKSVNYSHIRSLNTDIFMDGYNFFNKINFLYDSSSNYLNLIGFHNDYTYGIVAKTYRMKELGLYELDDNGYYSSHSNNYLFYAINKYDNKTYLTTILSTLMYICKKLNRVLIFPRIPCKECNNCTFVKFYNLEYFENKCGNDYRENSFLYSKKIPLNMIKNALHYYAINNNSDIFQLQKIKSQLIIIDILNITNRIYMYCFRSDNLWQRRFKR